jgi:hypothetical protein
MLTPRTHRNTSPILMDKFFSAKAAEDMLQKILASNPRTVLLLDTPATEHLVTLVKKLVEKGIKVIVRDHHDFPNPANPREQAIHESAQALLKLASVGSIISNRTGHPSCPALVQCGEFQRTRNLVIVADPDADGLLTAMKALGLGYSEMDRDADYLDGGRDKQTAENLSEMALLLVRAMSALPPFNPDRPEILESAKTALFTEFVTMVTGAKYKAGKRYEAGIAARKALETKALQYEEAVADAHKVITTAITVAPKVLLVDARGLPKHDMATVTNALKARGAAVVVTIKDTGPLAAKYGTQYSAVATDQKVVNLQNWLPSGFLSGVDNGIISNTSFLLHVTEQIWNEIVLPAAIAANL